MPQLLGGSCFSPASDSHWGFFILMREVLALREVLGATGGCLGAVLGGCCFGFCCCQGCAKVASVLERRTMTTSVKMKLLFWCAVDVL